ncbi:MAG: hypothetical protein AAF202_09505, partial [Pseudomonadota bacterium]
MERLLATLIIIFSLATTGCLLDQTVGGEVIGSGSESALGKVTHDDVFNSLTTSPSLSWSGYALEASDRLYYAVGTSEGATDVLAWTSLTTSLPSQISSLSLSSGTRYYISIRAVSESGSE